MNLLLCLYVLIVAPDKRDPKINDAWFNSSLRMRLPCKQSHNTWNK